MKTLNIKKMTLLLWLPLFFSGPLVAADNFGGPDVIWAGDKNVFVKYAKQDKSRFGQNDHPVELAADEIGRALAAIRFLHKDGDASGEGQDAAFTVEQVELLSRHLAKGLAGARPGQDIVFALDKKVRKLFGSIPKRVFVAGRVFYKEGKLNLIIGDYDSSGDAGFAAAYDPTHVGIVRYQFDFGRRAKSSNEFRESIQSVQGIETKQLGGKPRNDWLVIDLKLASQAPVQPAQVYGTVEPAHVREQPARTLAEPARTSEPAQVIPDRPAASPVAPAATVAPASSSIESRLITLNGLRDKGLITDEEYARKRREILDDL